MRVRIRVCFAGALWGIIGFSFFMLGLGRRLYGQMPSEGYMQPLNAHWQYYYNFRELEGITGFGSRVYAWSREGVLSYDGRRGEVERLVCGRGLGESDVRAAVYVPGRDVLVVSYGSGLVEVIEQGGGRIGVSDLVEDVRRGVEPAVHALSCEGGRVIGISGTNVYEFSLDPVGISARVRIFPSYGRVVTLQSVGVRDGVVCVGTSDGAYVADLPLSSAVSFFREVEGVSGSVTGVAAERGVGVSGGGYPFCVLVQGSGSFSLYGVRGAHGAAWGGGPYMGAGRALTLHGGSAMFSVEESLYRVDVGGLGGEVYRSESQPVREWVSGLHFDASGGRVYASTLGSGLISLGYSVSSGVVMGPSEVIHASGPVGHGVESLSSYGGGAVALLRPLVRGGGGPLDGLVGVYTVWPEGMQGYGERLAMLAISGVAQCVAEVDWERSHYLVGTSQEGLLEVVDGEIVTRYGAGNSSLESVGGAVDVSGLLVDNRGRWWVFSRGSSNRLHVRGVDGGWRKFSLGYPFSYGSGDPILREDVSGGLWLSMYGSAHVMRIDPEAFVSSGGDGGYEVSLVHARQRYGSTRVHDFGVSDAGAVYVAGADDLVYAQVSRPLTGGGLSFSTVVFASPINPAVQAHMLDGYPLESVAVVPGGGLWVGSASLGLFQADPQRKVIVRNFSRGDSPMPSVRVTDLCRPAYGERLYVGTDQGFLSLVIDAVEGRSDLSGARVYPNPVRPGYRENVVIDGLVAGCSVKISDAGGRLVRDLECDGGKVLWDQRNGLGELVGSGVYVIYLADGKGRTSRVLKVAIVR